MAAEGHQRRRLHRAWLDRPARPVWRAERASQARWRRPLRRGERRKAAGSRQQADLGGWWRGNAAAALERLGVAQQPLAVSVHLGVPSTASSAPRRPAARGVPSASSAPRRPRSISARLARPQHLGGHAARGAPTAAAATARFCAPGAPSSSPASTPRCPTGPTTQTDTTTRR